MLASALLGPVLPAAQADSGSYQQAIGADQSAQTVPALSRERALALGLRIWENESNRSYAGLTAWNTGEEFASLGIGHFIWYPAGVPRKFEESFPALIAFIRESSSGRAAGMTDRQPAAVPAWLTQGDLRCPWPTRRAFLREFDSPRMVELRDFLAATVAPQSAFIAQRLAKALPAMLAATDPARRDEVRGQFEAVHATDTGLYALIDYVNFKGEGTAASERYQGRGWGLLQVLEFMAESARPARGGHPANAFADGAEFVLRRRVDLSPPERGERRWLQGWMKRVDSYRIQ